MDAITTGSRPQSLRDDSAASRRRSDSNECSSSDGIPRRAGDGTLDTTVLPPTLVLAARFVAAEPQSLPPFPLTALHGALGSALRELGCGHGPRDGCRSTCPAGLLLEPTVTADSRQQGIRERASPALVLGAPITPSRAPVRLERGDTYEARLTLVGPRAIDQRALVIAALHRAAEMGLGVAPGRSTRRRPTLAIERVCSIEPVSLPAPPVAVVSFVTPTRLVRDGQVQPTIDSELLWRSLVRRADVLGLSHGGGMVCRDGPPPPAPFAVRSSSLRVVSVERWSSRQDSRMRWPGVVGAIEIAGDGIRDAWPLLQFAERVGLGKGTSFGLGSLRVLPTGD